MDSMPWQFIQQSLQLVMTEQSYLIFAMKQLLLFRWKIESLSFVSITDQSLVDTKLSWRYIALSKEAIFGITWGRKSKKLLD